MNGKIIVIDGTDGSGKTTQAELLYKRLKEENHKVMLISFPNYESVSSSLVKMYLNGNISGNLDDINSFAASSFYASDRYISYKCNWEEYYKNGYTIIAGRYVSSNLIHQMAKMNETSWADFKSWLYDYEYNKMGIPRPDEVIYLNMPRHIADNLIDKRCLNTNTKKDIHEINKEYLQKCATTALIVAKEENWKIIDCFNGEKVLGINIINDKILNVVRRVLG